MRRGSLVLAIIAVLAGPGASTTPLSPEQLERQKVDNALSLIFNKDPAENRAAVLIVNGNVVGNYVVPGYTDDVRFISWSMAKSVTAMLVGELVADGRLQLDAPAPIVEWRNDPRRAITLRHLLHMSSGLRHVEVGKPVENSDTNQVLFVSGTDDMAARAIARPLADLPGARFNYDSLTSIILSEIITRTLTPSQDPRVRAKVYRDFVEARLFRPAGATSAVLEFDGSGTQIGGSIMHMTLNGWARMGRLLLDGKGADGGQVIAPDWLAFMKTPAPTNPRYGGHVWLPESGLTAMRGHLGQFVIVGERNGHSVILVRLGKTQDNVLAPVQRRLEGIARHAVDDAEQGRPTPRF
jgi:CubicO group peptidase (beta-lactamase class C family)